MRGKSVLALGGLGVSCVLAGGATVVACAAPPKYVTSDIGGLQAEFNPNSAQNDVLVAQANAVRTNGTAAAQALLAQKTILIAAGGKRTDQSFNQSVWEAISKFSMEVGQPDNGFYETARIADDEQFNAYDFAIAKGFKFWILTGFYQEGELGRWLLKGNNTARFLANQTIVITVDWYPDDDPDAAGNGNPIKAAFQRIKGHILGLNFKTQESAFVTAYAAARLLSEIHADDPRLFPSGQTYLNSFGGGDFAGVTNFNYGFYEGLRQFNEDMMAGTIFPNQAKYFIRASAPVELSTGFALTNAAKAAVERQVDGTPGQMPPQIIFPVAGSLTAATIQRVRAKNQGQWIIGVDTDQALAFPNERDSLLTSVEKRIASAVYKALITLYGLTYTDAVNLLPPAYQLDDQRVIHHQGHLSNFNSVGGYDRQLVGVAPSTLSAQLVFQKRQNRAGKPLTYAQRYDALVAATQQSFFGSDGQSGRLYQPLSDVQHHGLKPPDEVIADFNRALKTEWPIIKDRDGLSPGDPNGWANDQARAQAVQANIVKVMALKNVAFGFLTAANQENYFMPIVKMINDLG